jgi:hypothetical protein
MGMVLHGWESPEASWAITVTAAALSGRHLVAILGIPLLLLAAAGAAVTVSGWRRSKRKDGVGVAAVALVVGVFVFHVVVPTGPEPRKLVMAAPAVLYLAAAGAAWLAGFSRRPWVAAGAPAALLAAAALAIPGVFGIAPKRSFGYREAIDYVESRPPLARSVMLVSSDAVGEGIAVTEVALRANHPSRFVLRATKALADSDWTARDYRLRFRTPETMMQRLDEIPVGLLLIDTEPYSAAAHHDLLRQVVARFRDRWELLCTFSGDGRSRGRQVLLYRLIGHETRPIGKIEVDLRRMLGRSITN